MSDIVIAENSWLGRGLAPYCAGSVYSLLPVSPGVPHEQGPGPWHTQMNLQIHNVISDITGVTGLAIVDAVLAGQRDGAELTQLRMKRFVFLKHY